MLVAPRLVRVAATVTALPLFQLATVLVPPLSGGQQPSISTTVVGLLALGIAAAYVSFWFLPRIGPAPGLAAALVVALAAGATAVALPAHFVSALYIWVYPALIAGFVVRPHRTARIIAVVTVGLIAMLLVLATVLSQRNPELTQVAQPLSVALLGGLLSTAVAQLIRTNLELHTAREELARLAIEEERARISRELHDVLGQSLTVMVAKLRLVARLSPGSANGVTSELSDLERLAREALDDLRQVAAGYRRPTLISELAGGSVALRAAGIAMIVDNRVGLVTPETEAVLAWSVREGITNVLRHSQARTCTVRIRQSASSVSVEVIDDGRGAAAAQAGIGLTGLQERVQAIGRSPGVGIRVEFGLHPSRHGADGRAARRRSTDTRGVEHREMIRVLLADDQGMFRSAIRQLLELEGDIQVVAEVSRGDEILSHAVATSPDVALLDIEMPGTDGLTAAGLLKTHLPSCHSLILTTFGRPGFLDRALASGAYGFVLKDASLEALAGAIRRCAAGEKIIDPGLAATTMKVGHSPLSSREREVLVATITGAIVSEIARTLHVTEGTVRNKVSSAISKLGARNRADAVRIASANGWL